MRYRLAAHSPVLSSRDRGARLLADLRACALGDASIVVDFAGVLAISHSFADEFVANLLITEPRPVALQGMDSRVRDVVEGALEKRDLALPGDNPLAIA